MAGPPRLRGGSQSGRGRSSDWGGEDGRGLAQVGLKRPNWVRGILTKRQAQVGEGKGCWQPGPSDLHPDPGIQLLYPPQLAFRKSFLWSSFSLHPHLPGLQGQAWTGTSGGPGVRGCWAGRDPLPTAPSPPRHKCCWGLLRGCPGPWRRKLWAPQARGRWAGRA